MTEDTEQQALDTFRVMNRYDGRHEDWPSEAVFERPLRTVANGWRKFHADRDCGFSHVRYVESDDSPIGERYRWDLYCARCGHHVPENEVLFVGGEWYGSEVMQITRETIDDLWLPDERVVDLGPDPEREELLEALRLTRIERDASFATPLSVLEPDDWSDCEECDHTAPMLFDGRCRMCYDGPWTDRMQQTLDAFERTVRVWHNQSFVHRIPQKLDPLAGDRVPKGRILWRRHAGEGTSKLVHVTQRLEDVDRGHTEYVLQDPTHTARWQYREEDLVDCFWDTGLECRGEKPVTDERIRELWQRVRERHNGGENDAE